MMVLVTVLIVFALAYRCLVMCRRAVMSWSDMLMR